MKRVLLSLVMTAVLTTAAWACNVPVFRYALESWRPDLCEVIVFHDQVLTSEQEQGLAALQSAAKVSQRTANVEVVRWQVGQSQKSRNGSDNGNSELWLALKSLPELSLPYVVVRTSVSDKKAVNGWRGPLAKFESAKLLDSPARQELSRRLLAGDSVVWLVLKSSDAERNASAKKLLSTELERLSKVVEFPEGLGLPGSELYAEIPLLMKFTVLEIDPQDPAEQFLVKLFHGFQPEAAAANQPLIVPVFGRGRALEVIPADRIDADLVGDLTRYLCGACSCQVKERNPGFDLLLSTQWDRELFGEDGVLPPPPKEYDPTQAPNLLTIPPGKATRKTP